MREIIRAAYVIGRRDFSAIIRSKAFFFFLIGPLFPVVIGVVAGNLGSDVARDIERPAIGVALSDAESQALIAARDRLEEDLGKGSFPDLRRLSPRQAQDAHALLTDRRNGFAAILSGTLAAPKLTGTAAQIKGWQGKVALLAGHARAGDKVSLPAITVESVRRSAGNDRRAQLITAQAGQTVLFLLTMLLAGMVLSNVVEEKSNKIIEILAAAIPIDAIFLGKLFAMLAMAGVGIVVWGLLAVGVMTVNGAALPDLTAPAVGWPVFLLLGVIYFSTAYLLLGAIFLGIGAQAATVREVQTLSMPVTMLQLVIFFFAMHTVTRIDTPIEQFASIFPLSSPFAMIARAAQDPTLWPHLIAIAGQGLFAVLILRVGAGLFRRNVMKSGSSRRGLIAALRGRA